MVGLTPMLRGLSTLQIFSSPLTQPTTSLSFCLGNQEAQLTRDGQESSHRSDAGGSSSDGDETQRRSQTYINIQQHNR